MNINNYNPDFDLKGEIAKATNGDESAPFLNTTNEEKILAMLVDQDRETELRIMKRSTEANLKQPALLKFYAEDSSNPMIECGAITIVKGFVGSHKSRLITTIIVALLSKNINRVNFLNTDEEIHVVLFDTEKHTNYALPEAIQNIKRCLDIDISATTIPNFNVSGLVEMDFEERFLVASERLRKIRQSNKEIHIVAVMDLVSDFVDNTNDIEQAKRMIKEIVAFANKENVSFLFTIHTNHKQSLANEKSAGHLGTEMEKKATVIVQIYVDDDEQIFIGFKKLRNVKPDKNQYNLSVNQDNGLLELIESKDLSVFLEKRHQEREKQFIVALLDCMNKHTFTTKGGLKDAIWTFISKNKGNGNLLRKDVFSFCGAMFSGHQICNYKLTQNSNKEYVLENAETILPQNPNLIELNNEVQNDDEESGF